METPMDMPAADAAKLVKRQVPELAEDGTPSGKLVDAPIEADDVFAVRVRGNAVTVITTDGRKLTGLLPEKAKK